MRAYLLALVAILLLTIGGIAFVYVATEDGAAPVVSAAPPPPQPIAEPPPPSVQAPLPPLPAGIADDPSRLPSAPTVSPARVKPKDGTWGAVPVAARASKLGANGAAVGRGLAQLGPMVSGCFSASVAMMDESNEVPTLVLHLESGTDQIHVVDAMPAMEGGATNELMACAIRAVKGRTFPAPGAKPGQRSRLTFPIVP